MKELLLSFDIGTSAIKTTLFQPDGTLLGDASYAYGTIGGGTTAEQDPEVWWQGALDTTKRLLAHNPEYARRIAAIGVSGHMLGCLPVDAQGEPLSNALIHADTRAMAEYDIIRNTIAPSELYRLSGSILSAQCTLSKVLWFERNAKQIYDRTAVFMQSKDYLVSKLTGDIDTTDYSDAQHAVLLNIHTKAYLNELFADLNLDTGKFAALKRGVDRAGSLCKKAAEALGLPAGIPVAAGSGDGACSNIGAGVTAANRELYISLGTTGWAAYTSVTPILDPGKRIFNVMLPDGESFGVFGTMQAAGKCVEWACDLLGAANAKIFDDMAAQAEAGSGGLIFLPYIDGERSPIFDANARGVFFGIRSRHTKAHFARAVLEGVAYAMNSIVAAFRENVDFRDARIVGGGANSGLWRQIFADVCALNVWTTHIPAGGITALGSAMTAGVCAGIYKDLDTAAKQIGKAQRLAPLSENEAAYSENRKRYAALYPRLKDLYPHG